MSAASHPFRRGRFEDLPELPRQPHPFAQTQPIELSLESRGFGRMRVHVRRYGSGPPLLLVHGLMTSSYSWRYAFEGLGARFSCYAPDLPGAGRSEGPLEPRYGPSELAGWLGEVQTALGIRGCPVVGNSMGGYLCMRLALDDPGAMSRLVNVHSPGLPEARLYALAAALSIPGARALLRRLVQRDPLRWAHRNVHYYDESLKSLEEAREYGGPLATADGVAAFLKYLAETMSPRPMRAFVRELRRGREERRPFPVPLLLLYAERDPMVPPRVGDALASLIPDAKLVRLREASHFAHVDAVERFLPPVFEFLDAGSATARPGP
jgi:pimeloyl-ACP methyl ester carboxylesterase